MDTLVLRPMVIGDVQQMENWRLHEDPWFYHYNFDCKTEYERLRWLKSKRVFLSRDIFGLFLGEKMIGFITIKNYNFLKRTAEMGISMDLNYVNKGYGTKGLELYLEYVFKHTVFNQIILRTASFNKRAICSYLKAGFEIYKKTFVPYEEQRFAVAIEEAYPEADVIETQVYSSYYLMRVKKKNVRKNNEF